MFEPTAGCTYRQLCWERGNIHCVRPLGRMHTILVFSYFFLILPYYGSRLSLYFLPYLLLFGHIYIHVAKTYSFYLVLFILIL